VEYSINDEVGGGGDVEMQNLGGPAELIGEDDDEYGYLMNETKEPPMRSSKKHHHVVKKVPYRYTNEELIVWYLRAIFFLLAALVGVVIALLVLIAIATPVITTSEQFTRAVRVVDQIYTMKDLTKNMADVTMASRASIEKAVADYDVVSIIHAVKAMAQRGSELVGTMSPETINKATETGAKLVDSLQKIDFEQGKALMQNVNRWSTAIDPARVSGSIDEANAFLKKTTETLQHAHDTHLMESIQQFAAGGVELEARLKRLNQITLKLPDA
jgi:hypothetical protein